MRGQAGESEQFLFSGNAPDKPLQGIKKFWRGATAQVRLKDYRIHDNRHTHASQLVSSRLSLEIVGRLLGRTSPMTTKRHAHLVDDPLRTTTERFDSKVDASKKLVKRMSS